MIRKSLVFALLFLAGGAYAAETSDPAAKAAQDFYSYYQTHPFTGLPDKNELAITRKYFSASLIGLMKHAQSAQATCIKKYPDDKPPWIEGDMFSSNFEGFSEFKIEPEVSIKGGRRTVFVSFRYIGQGDDKPVEWKDRVILVQQHGAWLIDDVRYGGHWSFSSGFGGGLRKSLSGDGECG